MGASNDLLNQILSQGPSQSTLLLVLSEKKKEGRVNEVIRECVKALEKFPHDPRLRHLLAEAYMEAGFIGLAEAELDRLASQLDDLLPAYLLQSDIYIRQGRQEEAAQALKRYLAHRPEDEAVQTRLKGLKKTDVPLQSEMMQPLEAEAPPEEREISDLATPTLAEIFYNQGQIYEAISTYEKVLALHPQDEDAMRRLAELKAMEETEARPLKAEDKDFRKKKEKMISILDGWLTRIQELNRGG